MDENKISTGLFNFEKQDDNTLLLTDYLGTDAAVTVPSEASGYPVTEIDIYAFRDNSTVTEVTVPEGVTVIRAAAFKDCKNLKRLNLPASLTEICDLAFDGCGALSEITVAEGSKSFTVNDGLLFDANMEYLFFCPRDRAGEIIIQKGTRVIKPGAFALCTELDNSCLPAGLQRIESGAFERCDSLPWLFIPPSVNEIDMFAFDEDMMLIAIRNTYGAIYAEKSGLEYMTM